MGLLLVELGRAPALTDAHAVSRHRIRRYVTGHWTPPFTRNATSNGLLPKPGAGCYRIRARTRYRNRYRLTGRRPEQAFAIIPGCMTSARLQQAVTLVWALAFFFLVTGAR